VSLNRAAMGLSRPRYKRLCEPCLSDELGSAVRSRRGEIMARKTVVVSDMSGEQIPEGKGAKVRITFDDTRSGAIEMDVTADEARAMGAKGRPVARRGRKPKSG
jgi:hypothetical protein